MARGPGRVGLRSAQAWWVPVMAVAVTAVVTAAVFKLLRFRRGSKGAQNRNDDDSEVAVEEVTSSEPYEPLIVSQEDWASLAETALGQEIQSTDRKLQLLVERSFPCDAVDILHALFQPGSTFWALWQQEQHHHHINIGDWLKESTPLGTNAALNAYSFLSLIAPVCDLHRGPSCLHQYMTESLRTLCCRIHQVDERMQV